MLSEKEIAALKKGAYGVTRDGRKVKYLGKVSSNTNGWLTFNKLNEIQDVFLQYSTFASYFNKTEHELDIVGLWEDKPEPFDLERALAGEPIVKDGIKYWVIGQSKIGLDYFIIEHEKGKTETRLLQSLENKFTMWKEPEQVKPSADDLPKPIRDFGGLSIVWYIKLVDGIYEPNPSHRGANWSVYQKTEMNNGCYYATKEDCQAVCDWLMNR